MENIAVVERKSMIARGFAVVLGYRQFSIKITFDDQRIGLEIGDLRPGGKRNGTDTEQRAAELEELQPDVHIVKPQTPTIQPSPAFVLTPLIKVIPVIIFNPTSVAPL